MDHTLGIVASWDLLLGHVWRGLRCHAWFLHVQVLASHRVRAGCSQDALQVDVILLGRVLVDEADARHLNDWSLDIEDDVLVLVHRWRRDNTWVLLICSILILVTSKWRLGM